jgi:predicted dehydrogenase
MRPSISPRARKNRVCPGSVPDLSALGVAVVGLGWWGRVIAPLLRSSEKLQLVLGVDPVATGFDFPVVKRYEEALAHPGVNAVVLCTPHSLHTDQIVAAARAKKHVFCEKPLSLSRREVLRAVEACNENRVALAVGHEKRFEPPIQELMRMVKAGELGTPLQIEANFVQDKFLSLPPDNWRLSQREAPAGPMTATGIHLLDLSIGVMGPAERVLASVRTLASQLKNGDTLGILVNFKSGGNALINACLATPFDGRLAVYGSKGWAEVRDKAHPEAPQGWTLTIQKRGEPRVARELLPAKAVLANLEAFADAAAGRAPYPVPQAEMIANVAALEAIFRSAASGAVERVDG